MLTSPLGFRLQRFSPRAHRCRLSTSPSLPALLPQLALCSKSLTPRHASKEASPLIPSSALHNEDNRDRACTGPLLQSHHTHRHLATSPRCAHLPKLAFTRSYISLHYTGFSSVLDPRVSNIRSIEQFQASAFNIDHTSFKHLTMPSRVSSTLPVTSLFQLTTNNVLQK